MLLQHIIEEITCILGEMPTSIEEDQAILQNKTLEKYQTTASDSSGNDSQSPALHPRRRDKETCYLACLWQDLEHLKLAIGFRLHRKLMLRNVKQSLEGQLELVQSCAGTRVDVPN